jgi:hypothetical protein
LSEERLMGAVGVADALDLLRTSGSALTRGLFAGDFTFWLGSGISLSRVPGLRVLIFKLLKWLWQQETDPRGPYRTKLGEIVEMAPNIVDAGTAPDLWDPVAADDFLGKLVNSYTEIFGGDIMVAGVAHPIKELFDIPSIYDDAAIVPDAEHHLVVALSREGVVSEIITTNWDPLLERAEEAARGSHAPCFYVVVCADDFARGRNGSLTRLLKIHGCARSCVANPGKFKPYFIVTRLDLGAWKVDARFQGFRDTSTALLTGTQSLFVGLSVQDFNLLLTVLEANQNRCGFDPHHPRLIFAPNLQSNEKTAVKAVYGEDVYARDAVAITSASVLPLYGKPLFGGLYLLVLREKLATMAGQAVAPFAALHVGLVHDALAALEQVLVAKYDAVTDLSDRWRLLCNELRALVSRSLRLYRRQTVPVSPEEYESLCDCSISRLQQDPNAHLSSIPWMLLVLSLCLKGQALGHWQVMVPASLDGSAGHLRVTFPSGRVVTLFLCEHATGHAALLAQGFVAAVPAQPVVVVYPTERALPPVRTSPHTVYPGAAPSASKELAFKELVESASSLPDLIDALRQELA